MGVESIEVLVPALCVAVAGLSSLARWIDVPYPIVLLLGGLAIGFIPGVPEIELDPEVVLLGFLPPLLYSAAFFSDLQALRVNARPISFLAIGLVLATMVVVAVVAHELIDGLSWPAAFTLGAIVAPTDPIAATAIMERLGAPRRLVNVIEGESLVNDATALVAYRVAIAAAVGGSFSMLDALGEFAIAAAGGAAIGLAVGWLSAELRERLDDPPVEIGVSLFTGYAAFLPAEELGLSGILAAVVAGVWVGWRAPAIASPEVRLLGFAFWEILVFLLNAGLFILLGLQLQPILDALSGNSTLDALRYALLISAIVIGVRFAWMFTVPYLIRMVDRRPQMIDRRSSPSERIVGAWSGMRGAVSLAAALAIPFTTDTGAGFPERDLILLITFGVIVVTMVGQGLTLPYVIRRLGVRDEGADEVQEVRARIEAAQAALVRLDELAEVEWTRDQTIERVRRMYEWRQRRFAVRAGEVDDEGIEDQSIAYQRLMHELYAAQRAILVELRNRGEISNDVMHRIERDLDLEESRLEV
jgi:Na+/H+ antiporter